MKQSTGEKIFSAFNYLILTFLAVVCIVPVWHVLCASFSDPYAVATSHNFILHPLQTFQTEAYKIILSYDGLWRGYHLCRVSVCIGSNLLLHRRLCALSQRTALQVDFHVVACDSDDVQRRHGTHIHRHAAASSSGYCTCNDSARFYECSLFHLYAYRY